MSNRENAEGKRRLFIPSISLDGITVICAVIWATLKFGNYEQWRSQVDTTLQSHAAGLSDVQRATVDLDKRTYSLEAGKLPDYPRTQPMQKSN